MKRVFFLIFFSALFYSSCFSINFADLNFPSFGSYLNDQPPEIEEVNFYPENPLPHQNVKIEVKVTVNPYRSPSYVKDVSVFYFTDKDRSFKKIDLKKCKDNKWRGELPGFPEDTTVEFFVYASDSFNNTAVELPNLVKNFPPSEEELIEVIKDYQDTERENVDIVSGSVGYDGEKIYFKYEVKGKVRKGSSDTFAIHGYAVGIDNPDLKSEDHIRYGSELSDYKTLAYIPFLSVCDFFENLMQVLDFGKAKGKKIDSSLKEGKLYLSVDKKYFKKNPSNRLKIVYLALSIKNITDIENLDVEALDCSNFSNIYFRTHKFYIK
jgi:hypothetical protein